REDLLYALAELNYSHARSLSRSVKPGESKKAPDFYLSSAIYAWIYLFGKGKEAAPNPFDRRFRVACDLYNQGEALGFQSGLSTKSVVLPPNGQRILGPGTVDVQFSRPAFKWKLEDIATFLPADELAVRGLSVRDRQSGLGAPLIAVGKMLDRKKFPRSI